MDTEQRTYELQLAATDAGLDQLTPISVSVDEAMSRPYRVVLQARTMVAGDPTAFKPSTWLRNKVRGSYGYHFRLMRAIISA